MDRTADHTIQGFLYQFHKSLLEVLRAADDAEITIEGIIEDIEIAAPAGLTAIQCKYHEAKENFAVSTIFKPVLQMMQHFQANPQANISYVLFAHFPNPPANYTLSKADLDAALASTNKELRKYCDALRGRVDLNAFLLKFSMQFGPSWDGMVEDVRAALVTAGIPKGDVDVLAYPNAIQEIANLGIEHDGTKRKVTKAALLLKLATIKSTAITRWTLALKQKKQFLEAKRKQLKSHLGTNTRLRYFIVNCTSLQDFDVTFVGFVCDFLTKYHFKPVHISTPLFCLDTTEDIFRDIQLRLHRKGVVANDGYVGRQFDTTYFFRQPLIQKGRMNGDVRREFNLRLLRWEGNGAALAQQKSDDLFIIGTNRYAAIDTKDVCVEVLEASSVKEIAFITGVNHTYE